MNELPKRKHIRIPQYDYSAPGAYFITICSTNREEIFWANRRGELCSIKNENRLESVGADIIRPQDTPLSYAGVIVEKSVLQIPEHYGNISVDKYCIMPDHVHIILSIRTDEDGRMISAPTVSTVVGSMKRWVSKQLGRSIWQKSFYEHTIRNQQDYDEIWEYIENNPLKYIQKRTP